MEYEFLLRADVVVAKFGVDTDFVIFHGFGENSRYLQFLKINAA